MLKYSSNYFNAYLTYETVHSSLEILYDDNLSEKDKWRGICYEIYQAYQFNNSINEIYSNSNINQNFIQY